MYAEDPEIRKKLEKEWEVSMNEMEYNYYEGHKTERKMFCSKGVDPVWYHSMMKVQRMREREEDYRRERDQQLATKAWMPSLRYLLRLEL